MNHPFLNKGVGVAKEMPLSTLTIEPNEYVMDDLIKYDLVNNKDFIKEDNKFIESAD